MCLKRPYLRCGHQSLYLAEELSTLSLYLLPRQSSVLSQVMFKRKDCVVGEIRFPNRPQPAIAAFINPLFGTESVYSRYSNEASDDALSVKRTAADGSGEMLTWS